MSLYKPLLKTVCLLACLGLLVAAAPAGELPLDLAAKHGPDELAKGEADLRQGPPVLRGAGGPDSYGYRWRDSDEPGGPGFYWDDITGVGTSLVLFDDDHYHAFLPWTFSFYGVSHTTVKICSNGYLTFGTDPIAYINDPIPYPYDPNDFIAPFWDDLDPELGGTVHYYHDATLDRFIVQYTDIPHHYLDGTYSFQVILYPDGGILFQYLAMTGVLDSATIGIENPAGDDGLQVAYNTSYVHDGLAVYINWLWPVIDVAPGLVEMELPEGESDLTWITIYNGGSYLLNFTLSTSEIVREDGSPVELASPASVRPVQVATPPALAKRERIASSTASLASDSPGELPRTPSQPGEFPGSRWGENVLVVRDFLPWSGDIVPEFIALGANVTVIPSADLATVPLGNFDLLYISGGSTENGDPTHVDIMTNMWRIDDYVSAGGTFFFVSGTWGAVYTLPGGVESVPYQDNDNFLVHDEHPIAQEVSNPFHGNNASHDYWINLPYDATVVTMDSNDEPTSIVYPYEMGRIVALGMPAEWFFNAGGWGDTYPDMPLLWRNAARYSLALLPGWLDLDMITDRIWPGDGEYVYLTFDASGLSPGIYTTNLVVTSNDPITPQVFVPLTLTVIEPPSIGVSPPVLAAMASPGGTDTQILTIENTGDVALTYDIVLLESGIPVPRLPIAVGSGARAFRAGESFAPAASGERISGSDRSSRQMDAASRALHESWLAGMGDRDNVIFFDDMESGASGWIVWYYGPDSMWHHTGRNCASPIKSWWCGDEMRGDYQTGNTINTAAVTPPIDLGPYAGPLYLEFFENFDTELNYDYCMVDVSIDDGVSWTNLRGDYGAAPSGDSNGWVLSALDLSPYAGETIKLRFLFATGDPVANDYPGWFFDDVLIVEGDAFWMWGTPLAGTVPPDGSVDVTFEFDAAGLPLGDHTADLLIRTNDPNAMTVNVPVIFSVEEPEIDTTPSMVNATVEWPDATTRNLVIENVAGGNLEFHIALEGGRGIREIPRGPIDIMLLCCNASFPIPAGVAEIQSSLAAYPDIASVDVFNYYFDDPVLADLQPYHVAIVSSNSIPPDPIAIGDMLADYVDQGGGIVITEATFLTFFGLAGRFFDEGYSPFELTDDFGYSGALGDYDPDHPIMAGVSTATGDLLANPTLSFGSEWVADWDLPTAMIATKGEQIVAVNVFYENSGYWTGDIPLILHNAAIWTVDRVGWLSVSPVGGSVPGGGSTLVQVSFESADLYVGTYGANILVYSNDPLTPELVVPVNFQVNDNTPVLLSFFELETEPGVVTARWELAGDSDPADFRLLGSRDAEQWELEFSADGAGIYTARDESAILADGGDFRYSLSCREAGGDWQLLRSENVNVEALAYPTQLLAAHPNPFNPTVTIPFTLDAPGRVKISIYDVTGQRVLQLADDVFTQGRNLVVWRGSDDHGRPAATGVYFVRMESKGFKASQKLILLR